MILLVNSVIFCFRLILAKYHQHVSVSQTVANWIKRKTPNETANVMTMMVLGEDQQSLS